MAAESVWGSLRQTATSLDDVMSEQMATELQNKENQLVGLGPVGSPAAPVTVECVEVLPSEDVSSDRLLAEYMQDCLDRESDEQLHREELKLNGHSKVSVSFENYRLRSKNFPIFESESEEEYYDDDADRTREWDSFEARERMAPRIPPCGYTMHKHQMVTKHDRKLADQRNACKVMDLPPNICTGDGGGFDMEVNNKVLNTLRLHARADSQRKRHREIGKDDHATWQMLDSATRIIAYKLTNSGVLERLDGITCVGKDSTVFHAVGGSSDEMEIPEECALKVFRTALNEFKTREKYIKADIRFKDRISRHVWLDIRGTSCRQNPRHLIHLWAEKEMCNLRRLARAKIRCPQPLLYKQHVLLMSFIGENGRPAPKLKDAVLTDEQWRSAYSQVLEMTKDMYAKCDLVHADLSAYNILYHAGFCWFIDVSQSVQPFHPGALQFLHRDCDNISSFFQRKIADVMSAEEMFTYVSGLPLSPDNVNEQLASLEQSEQPRRRGQRRAEEEEVQQWRGAEEADEPEPAGGEARRHARQSGRTRRQH